MGWSPRRPAARARPATAGSRCRRWSPRPRSSRPAEPDADLAGFVAELDRRAHEQHAPVAEGVTLATLHAAKGLEWDAVFLCGVQEGSMPITYADTPAEVEEERRLLYVGVTRARAAPLDLVVAGPQPRQQARRKPSRFLADLRPEPVHRPRRRAGAPQLAARRASKAAVCQIASPAGTSRERNRGYCDDCPVPYDEELFELLQAWRKERPTPQSVPGVRGVLRRHPRGARRGASPTDRKALKSINGIGAAKLEKYADELLEIIA